MEYLLKRSKRRTLAVEIKADGTVVVHAPQCVSTEKINAFLREKSAWIEKYTADITRFYLSKYSDAEIQEFVVRAKRELPKTVGYYANLIGVSYSKITVRRQKTLWGSCTARGNLSFNCLLVELPREIAEYVVVHELCHRKQMNHSRAFWNEVAAFCPDYKQKRKWLKSHGREYLLRL